MNSEDAIYKTQGTKSGRAAHFNSFVGAVYSDPGSTVIIDGYIPETDIFQVRYNWGGPDNIEEMSIKPADFYNEFEYLMDEASQKNFFDENYILPAIDKTTLVINLPDGAEASIEHGKVFITVGKPTAAYPLSDVLYMHLCDGDRGNLGESKAIYRIQENRRWLDIDKLD